MRALIYTLPLTTEEYLHILWKTTYKKLTRLAQGKVRHMPTGDRGAYNVGMYVTNSYYYGRSSINIRTSIDDLPFTINISGDKLVSVGGTIIHVNTYADVKPNQADPHSLADAYIGKYKGNVYILNTHNLTCDFLPLNNGDQYVIK